MTNLAKQYIVYFSTMITAYAIGWYIDRTETLRLTGYRDKSALFGRELKPGEPPSWP